MASSLKKKPFVVVADDKKKKASPQELQDVVKRILRNSRCLDQPFPDTEPFKPCRVVQHLNVKGHQVNEQGRVRVSFRGKYYLATRLVLMNEKGWTEGWPPEETRVISHLCDVPNCCEVSHMELTSTADNIERRGCLGWVAFETLNFVGVDEGAVVDNAGICVCPHEPRCARVTFVDASSSSPGVVATTRFADASRVRGFANEQARMRQDLKERQSEISGKRAEKKSRLARAEMEKKLAKTIKADQRRKKRLKRKEEKLAKQVAFLSSSLST